MPNKAYLELTNICNLDCSFCHKTKRAPRMISDTEFTRAATQLRTFADYLYFHLMGEPLLHPRLTDYITEASEMGFRAVITTNGTLLGRCADALLSSPVYKVSISLHSYEANKNAITIDSYLNDCFSFAKRAAEKGIICVLRLWNEGGCENTLNSEIIARMHEFFDTDGTTVWKETYSGYKIAEYLFLETAERFEWPDENAQIRSESHYCYGLGDQVGVLCDGTVVPCCLDADGSIALGNIFDEELSDILMSERVQNMRAAFRCRKVTEELCRRCGYAAAKKFR